MRTYMVEHGFHVDEHTISRKAKIRRQPIHMVEQGAPVSGRCERGVDDQGPGRAPDAQSQGTLPQDVSHLPGR